MQHMITMDSPIGTLSLLAQEQAITGLYFGVLCLSDVIPQTSDILEQAKLQLLEYFDGTRQSFDLPIHMTGTDFQCTVWRALQDIPYGTTATYGEVAAAIGNPNAARAVGLANNRNPISIIVPCHRVIGATGKLVGYGGGLDKKTYLLNLEGAAD